MATVEILIYTPCKLCAEQKGWYLAFLFRELFNPSQKHLREVISEYIKF